MIKMRTFTERLTSLMVKQGFYVFQISHLHNLDPRAIELIDFICMKHDETIFIRARENGFDIIRRVTRTQLQKLGSRCNAKVLHATTNNKGQIVFFRIYER